MSKITAASVLVVAFAQCGCGSKGRTSASPEGCIPASVRRCVGSWSCKGNQACFGDGTQWSECVCDDWASAGGGADAGATDGSVGPDAVAVDLLPEAPPLQYVLLDDMESTAAPNGPIRFVAAGNLGPGFWGSWRSTGDPSNTMVPDPYSYSPLSAPHQTMDGITSMHAGHLACHIADRYGYCEQALWLAQGAATLEPNATARTPVDLSAYRGLVFWAMASKSCRLKVLFENVDTDALGGKCGQADASADQCGDAFSKSVSLTTTWKRYEVRFSELAQAGWGHAAPSGKLDPRAVYIIGFQIDGPQSSVAPPVENDFWVDDIYFEQPAGPAP